MNALMESLIEKAFEIRKDVLEMCVASTTGHFTSSLSCTDILVALYYGGLIHHDPKNPDWEDRDRFILSKGQASPALYAVLADCGYYAKEELWKFAQVDGIFGVHLQHSVPGVEITAGALGHGYGVAAGLALGARMNRQHHLVYALLGDGEMYEGSVWETAMFASAQRLNNLVTIIDRNYQCTTDYTENLIELEPLEDKWASFGFDVERLNGHSVSELVAAMGPVRSRSASRPLVIIADTVKGKGVPFIENTQGWHGIAPKGDDIERCRKEIERMSV